MLLNNPLSPPSYTARPNYYRANDVAGWQPTPTTDDAPVTKIAGYVRVRILMYRRLVRAARRPLLMTTGTSTTTGVYFEV